jgi:hypothetical protein
MHNCEGKQHSFGSNTTDKLVARLFPEDLSKKCKTTQQNESIKPGHQNRYVVIITI